MTACGTDEQSEGIASIWTAFFRLFQSVQTSDQIGACPSHCHCYSRRRYTVSKQTSFVPSDMSWDISHVRNCARKCRLTDTDKCIGQSVIHSVSRSFVQTGSQPQKFRSHSHLLCPWDPFCYYKSVIHCYSPVFFWFFRLKFCIPPPFVVTSGTVCKWCLWRCTN